MRWEIPWGYTVRSRTWDTRDHLEYGPHPRNYRRFVKSLRHVNRSWGLRRVRIPLFIYHPYPGWTPILHNPLTLMEIRAIDRILVGIRRRCHTTLSIGLPPLHFRTEKVSVESMADGWMQSLQSILTLGTRFDIDLFHSLSIRRPWEEALARLWLPRAIPLCREMGIRSTVSAMLLNGDTPEECMDQAMDTIASIRRMGCGLPNYLTVTTLTDKHSGVWGKMEPMFPALAEIADSAIPGEKSVWEIADTVSPSFAVNCGHIVYDATRPRMASKRSLADPPLV